VVPGPIGAGEPALSEAATTTVAGASWLDQAGLAVAIGDYNRDELKDLVILSGEGAYVLNGPLKAGRYSLRKYSDVVYLGLPKSTRGSGGAMGDINDDGISDLIVGSPVDTVNGSVSAGRVYVILGE